MPKRWLLLASVVLVAACADDPLTPAGATPEPAFSHIGTHAFTGRMLGPDGGSLCESLWEGAVWRITAAETTTGSPHNYFGACPDDAFHLELPSGGSFVARIILPATPDLGTLPQFSFMAEPVVMDGDVARDVQVHEGATLAGGITVDGQPLDGITLGLQFAGLRTNYAGPSALSSGRRGPWLAPYAPVPMLLQPGIGYRLGSISLTGVVSLGPETSSSFVLGEDTDEVSLRFRTSRAARSLSHDATRLTASSLPGTFGGGRLPAEGPIGRGWGVQFPEAASHTGWTQLFDGGLMLLVDGKVLSGLHIDGHGSCPTDACHDLGEAATVHANPTAGGTRTVEWRYADRGPEAVGLEVVQRSFDGADGDYVLFHFSVRNGSDAAVSLNPGIFMDWDLDHNANDDVGETPAEFGGRLVLQTNDWGGNVLGTLFVSDGTPNPFFISNSGGGLLLEHQIGALEGSLTQPDAPDAHDWWYLQAGGAVTVAAGGSTEFWVALVAGETRPEALANAAAAEAAITSRPLD